MRVRGTPRSVFETHRVELNPVDERVLVDRPRVRGAVAQGLAVGLPARRTSASVIAENGTSSTASTSMTPGPTL